MKLSGHMIINNGVKYDYSFIQSCLSALPICDEFIFVEGMGGDGTYEKLLDLQKHYPKKIKIIQRKWEKQHFTVLSDMTNLAIENCSGKYHYQIQADEALHERYHKQIRQFVETEEFDLLGLDVLHFYSNFHTVFKPGVYYDTFHRIARTAKFPVVRSFSDAMTLGCPDDGNRVLRHLKGVTVHHYGYVRKPRALLEKQRQMTKWWGYKELDKFLSDGEEAGKINWHQKHSPDRLRAYTESHPRPMIKWIKEREQIVQEGTV